MTAQEGNQVSGSGGATNSVPHTREYFLAVNYGSWVSYVVSKGAHYDANGRLIYKGNVLCEADTEYIAEWEEAAQHLLTEEELRGAWLALLDVTGVSEA